MCGIRGSSIVLEDDDVVGWSSWLKYEGGDVVAWAEMFMFSLEGGMLF